MIKKTTQKIKSEVAKITAKIIVADKENGASHIIVGVDLSKSKLDVMTTKYTSLTQTMKKAADCSAKR